MISRICEEFHCTPIEAYEQPLALSLRIIEMRSYAWAKDALDRAKKQEDVPDHPMVDLVMAVQHDIIQERRRALRES